MVEPLGEDAVPSEGDHESTHVAIGLSGRLGWDLGVGPEAGGNADGVPGNGDEEFGWLESCTRARWCPQVRVVGRTLLRPMVSMPGQPVGPEEDAKEGAVIALGGPCPARPPPGHPDRVLRYNLKGF